MAPSAQTETPPVVESVHLNPGRGLCKPSVDALRLLAGLGVEGDVHCGARVQHRSRVAADPTQPNLRQVHLLQRELFAELRDQGHVVAAGELGENITTSGLRLLELPTGTLLRIGGEALLSLTGLRNPCSQLDGFQPGLLGKLAFKDGEGALVRRAGVMAVVVQGGRVQPGDSIEVALPPEPALPLQRV